jgi:hypothetical protein
VIAHIAGLPVEEVLPALMSGAAVLLVRTLTTLRSRRRTDSTDTASNNADI